MKKMFTRFIAGAALLGMQVAQAQNLPKGFSIEKVCDLESATSYAFAPDKSIFIAEQDGRVMLYKDRQLQSTPCFTVDEVKYIGEKGIIGIAVDPDYNQNKYVYVFSTKFSGSRFDFSLILERFTIVNDKGTQPTVILDMDVVASRFYEIWNHNGGGLRFGADGKLYIAVGYNDQVNQITDLTKYLSKIIRINKDGSAPSDNPFYQVGGNEVKNRVYAYGMRNPFTLHFVTGTNQVILTDVGSDGAAGQEEINLIKEGGKNLGFATYQGKSNDPELLDPIYQYKSIDQNSTVVETVNGCAITGAVHLSPSKTNYPDIYKNKIFFIDFCNGWLSYLDIGGGTAVRSAFGSGLGKLRKGAGHLSLEEGIDGNLYYLTRLTRTPDDGEIADNDKSVLNRIVYDPALSTVASNQLLLNCSIQPIPANNYFSVNLISATAGNATVNIIDMLGVTKQSNSFDVMQGENENDVDISTLPNGTYLVTIKADGRVANKKLVIE